MNKEPKIIKIISDMKVVVNLGSEDGIRNGTILEIYSPGEEVTDPDTGESLGTLDTIKAYIEVINVFPKMSICKNNASREYNALAGITQALIQTKTLPLDVDKTEITGGINNFDKIIHVGDLVRKSID